MHSESTAVLPAHLARQKLTLPEAPTHREKRIEQALRDFPKLPDDAGVSVAVAARLRGCGTATIWRRIKDGTLQVTRLGPGVTRVIVGSLRGRT